MLRKSYKWVLLIGATSSGKTFLSNELAKKFNSNILSFDSRQCYSEINIGVAKPSKLQLQRVKHFFINSHSVEDNLSAVEYCQYTNQNLEDIKGENDFCILTGGTGLYLDALLKGFSNIPISDLVLKQELNHQYEKNGIQWLLNQLKKNDEEYFLKYPEPNPQRWLRALLVKIQTGKSIISFWKESKNNVIIDPKEVFIIKITISKNELHERIHHRVIKMMNDGLLEEARSLFSKRHFNSLKTIGYQECFDFLEEKIKEEKELISLIQKNTRHYAKRQETWLKRYHPNMTIPFNENFKQIVQKMVDSGFN